MYAHLTIDELTSLIARLSRDVRDIAKRVRSGHECDSALDAAKADVRTAKTALAARGMSMKAAA